MRIRNAHTHNIQWNPLNKGHVGTSDFVHYKEVVLFSEKKMYDYIERLSSSKRVLYRRFHHSVCAAHPILMCYAIKLAIVTVYTLKPALLGGGEGRGEWNRFQRIYIGGTLNLMCI